jgi:hypothetical protein
MAHDATAERVSARTALVAVGALVLVLWTLAAVFTLVYWSGLGLWVLGAIILVGFAWILRVYLRPSASPHDT